MTTTSTVSSARSTLDAYFADLVVGGPFEQYLAPDVTADMVGTDMSFRGRDEVAGFIRAGHFQMFDSALEIVSMSVDETGRRAATELVFAGRHIGEFAGIPATGRDVRVPYSAHYELGDAGITALRIYGLAQGLISTLTS
ncbi:MAG TPA: ester cyclase [Microlunatus sp.]|nr:ester cyclase [Microlunatus sp.]